MCALSIFHHLRRLVSLIDNLTRIVCGGGRLVASTVGARCMTSSGSSSLFTSRLQYYVTVLWRCNGTITSNLLFENFKLPFCLKVEKFR